MHVLRAGEPVRDAPAEGEEECGTPEDFGPELCLRDRRSCSFPTCDCRYSLSNEGSSY